MITLVLYTSGYLQWYAPGYASSHVIFPPTFLACVSAIFTFSFLFCPIYSASGPLVLLLFTCTDLCKCCKDFIVYWTFQTFGCFTTFQSVNKFLILYIYFSLGNSKYWIFIEFKLTTAVPSKLNGRRYMNLILYSPILNPLTPYDKISRQVEAGNAAGDEIFRLTCLKYPSI